MNIQEQFRRNHRLFELYMKEVFRNPSLADRVPDKADIVMLPDDDPELRAENQKLAQKLTSEGRHPILLPVRLVPQTRTVLVPEIETIEPPH